MKPTSPHNPQRPEPLRTRRFAAFVLAGISALALSGCASAPEPPTDALQAAQMSIENAERARVADYAASELGDAREDLAAARTAVRDEDMALARRLALQSRANAELATARAAEAKARSVNQELQEGIDALKQEMQRNSGDSR